MFKHLTILLSIFLIGCNKDKNDSDLVVGTSADYPPFEYIENGELKGLDIELAKALAKEMGKKIQFKEMPFASLIPALQQKKLDIAISSITRTEERAKNVDFSNPYFFTKISLVVDKNAPYSKLEDFKNLKLGAQFGSIMEIWAKKNDVSTEPLLSLDTNPLLIEALKSKHIHAVIVEETQAEAFVAKNNTLRSISLGKVEEGYAIALPKDSHLTSQVNTAIEKLKTQKVLENIQKMAE